MGAAAILLTGAGPVAASLHVEAGDAGELPGTAQATPAGLLTTITGSIGFDRDRDIFSITITDPSTFSARTTLGGDTQLFLFNSAGFGILMDDDSAGGFLSLLPAGNPALTALTPGQYFLAISEFDDDPISLGGLIFGTGLGTEGPTGPGGAGAITGWNPDGAADTYNYSITLTGAAGSAVPEPGTALAGLALVGLVGVRRRRAE